MDKLTEALCGRLGEALDVPNPLFPLFRGLRQMAVARFGSEGDVVRAKREVLYDPIDLEHLRAGSNPQASRPMVARAYDVYWRWVVGSECKVVKALTGRPKSYWISLERRFEGKGL